MSEQVREIDAPGLGEFVDWVWTLKEQRDALHAEAEALLEREQIALAHAMDAASEAERLRTELEAARGLLRDNSGNLIALAARMIGSPLKELQGLIYEGRRMTRPRVGAAVEFAEARIKDAAYELRKIADKLAATPAQEVPDHLRDSAKMVEQGERQEVVPEETPHIIVFDDADRPNEVFSGAGARPAALRRCEQISVSWNAHLFVRVEKNSRDDPNPCARLATTPQPGPDVRALVHAAKKVITWLDWSAGLPGEDGEYMHVDVQVLRSAVERLEQQGEHS